MSVALVCTGATIAYAANGGGAAFGAGNTVQGVSPSGTTINLFKYVTGSDDGFQSEEGINKNHVLKFGAGIGTTIYNVPLDATNINHYTGTQFPAPRSGIVADTLGDDGFPRLSGADSIGTESLAYLFDGTTGADIKTAYMNVDGLLQVDADGYYYYNSQDNFAQFDSDGTGSGSFTLYDTWGVEAGGTSPDGQFFPFNTAEQVFDEGSDGSLIQKEGVNSASEEIKHYFGVSMSTQFIQQYGGHTDASRAQDVTYNFSGDDDVWVFIDGKLVGDLGGIHDKVSLQINFATGEVVIYTDGRGDPNTDNFFDADNAVDGTTLTGSVELALNSGQDVYWSKTTLRDLLGLNSATFADGTYHTLDFFYLERGNTDSNMALKYNLVTAPRTDISKVDQEGDYVGGATFNVYDTTDLVAGQPATEGKLLCANVVTDAQDGTVTLLDANGDPLTVDGLYADGVRKISLVETSAPAGYRGVSEIPLSIQHYSVDETGNKAEANLLLSEDPWTTGAYAQPKVTVATGGTVTIDKNGTSETLNADDLQRGLLFAVVEQQGDDGNWYPVTGDALTGWTVSDSRDMDAVIAAGEATNAVFTISTSGTYETEIEHLPGQIEDYEFFGGDAYHGAYYYTTASSWDEANATNTYAVTNTESFDRRFAARIYLSNILNRVLVQKTDEAGDPLNGAMMALFTEDKVEIATDGTVSLKDGVTAADALLSGETRTLSKADGDSIDLDGAVIFSHLKSGTYYVTEVAAPEGYAINGAFAKIIVDTTGVYADAGTADDGVSVTRGVGRIVRSMVQFATADDIDATLHDIVATPQLRELSDSGAWTWTNDDAATEQHLYFADVGDAVLDYEMRQDSQAYTVETGVPRLKIAQCDEQGHTTDPRQDIDGDITNLFTGVTIVHIQDEPVGKLDVTKQVDGPHAEETRDFTFTVTFTHPATGGAAASALTQEEADAVGMQLAIDDAAAEPVKIGAGGSITFTLHHGQTAHITNIPEGVSYEVAEAVDPDSDYTPSYSGNASGSISNDQTPEVTVTNTRTLAPAVAGLQATKTLNGASKGIAEGLFEFTIDGVSSPSDPASAPLPSEAQDGSVENDVDGIVNFGTFSFTDEGRYVYHIAEVQGNEPGVTYDKTTYTVVYDVAYDDQTRSLVASQSVYEGALSASEVDAATPVAGNAVVFKNTYQPEEVTSASFSGNKTVENEHGIFGAIREGQFAFRVTSLNAPAGVTAPMPSGAQNGVVTNDANGAFTFGTLTFTEPGVYTYQVKEDTGSIPGITYDATTYTLSFTVEDHAGKLEITNQTIKDEDGVDVAGADLDFTNIYNDGKTSITIEGTKVFEDNGFEGERLDENEFSFALYEVAVDGSETLVGTTKNGAATNNTASFSFDPIEYTDEGVHTYKVYELGVDGNPGTGGTDGNQVTYAREVYTAVVTVTEANDGRGLAASLAVTDAEGMPAQDIIFTNSYAPTPVTITFEGTKTLEVASGSDRGLQAGEFTFALVDQNGQEVERVTNDANGAFAFDEITFDQIGTYTYTVSEVPGGLGGVGYDTTVYRVEVVVTENATTNALEATATYYDTADPTQPAGDLSFTNTYQAQPASATIVMTKLLEGGTLSAGQFTFELTAAAGAPLPSETVVANAADGTVTFGPISFDAAGEYDYTVSEVNDGQDGIAYDEDLTRTAHVSVTDNGSGQLVATVTYGADGSTFTNTVVPPERPDAPEDDKLAGTGDASLVAMAGALGLAAIAMGAAALLARRRV